MSIDTTVSDSSIRLSNVEGVSTFIVSIPKEDYTSMIIYKKYRRAEENRPVSYREYAVLQPYGNMFLMKKYGKPLKYLVHLILNVINYFRMQNPDMHVVPVNVDPPLNVTLIILKNLLPN